ncbi:MAG: hypothetical protein GX434_17725 [Peptococcaceae bacterium]|nr:hypothetical protein [Peptococcaceae bacterium]
MKKLLLTLLMALAVVSLLSGCNSPVNQSDNPEQKISAEEKKRMELYIAVMKDAFQKENGGNAFIAVKLETLEGLNDEAKSGVLKGLNELSPHVYNFDDVKNDNTKFKVNKNKGNRNNDLSDIQKDKVSW